MLSTRLFKHTLTRPVTSFRPISTTLYRMSPQDEGVKPSESTCSATWYVSDQMAASDAPPPAEQIPEEAKRAEPDAEEQIKKVNRGRLLQHYHVLRVADEGSRPGAPAHRDLIAEMRQAMRSRPRFFNKANSNNEITYAWQSG